MSRFVPRPIDTVVTSFGGAGTTFLIEHLSPFRSTNDHHDGDALKHLPMPPVSFHPRIRFVYLLGDPLLAAVSLFQRGMQHEHSKKLLALRPDLTPIPGGMPLEAYARAGADRFHFRAHFDNWHEHYPVHPTLFLRYESLWDNLDALAEFLELPREAIDAFPARRERNARLDDLPADTLAGLERMYGGLRDQLAALPGAETRGMEWAGKRMRLLRTRNFRMALGRAANAHYRTRLRNPLSNALERALPRVHSALVRARRRVTGD